MAKEQSEKLKRPQSGTLITVVCWKWKPKPDYHCLFTAEHVNRLKSMVSRNLPLDHEFVCITDDAEGIDKDIRVIPLWPELGFATHPKRPNCYRRLKAFEPEAEQWLGSRILSLDLDCVITGDLTPLVDRKEDFIIYGDTATNTPYNGSMWLLRAGTRAKVWSDFDPETTPYKTQQLNMIGSDQAAIAAALGPNEAKYGTKDGVYAYMRDIKKKNKGELPKDARIVFFFGPYDPTTSNEPWVAEHYR